MQVENDRGAHALGEVMLCCAGCGDNFMHHARVTIHERDEDASRTDITFVTTRRGGYLHHDKQPEFPAGLPGNPSSRRGGIAVEFTCESCSAVTVLTISQHKGQTLLDTYTR